MSAAAPVDKLVAKLRCYDRIGEAEERALARMLEGGASFPKGATLIREGQRVEFSTLLLSGFVHRYKDLADGRRQSLELNVPGDFVDLHSFTLKRLDHTIRTLSACRVAYAPHERIRQVTAEFPHLTRVLWLSTTIDAALHRERIMSLGARTAVERLAHFLCETAKRLEAVGLGSETGFDLPLTQGDLAELLGLSMVHMNRTVRDLRERNLAVLRGRRAEIVDWAGLAALGQFDPAYLRQRQEPH